MDEDVRFICVIGVLILACVFAAISIVAFVPSESGFTNSECAVIYSQQQSKLTQCRPIHIDDQFSVFTDAGLTDKVVIDSTVYTLAYDEASIGNRSVSLRGQTRMVKVYGDVVVVC